MIRMNFPGLSPLSYAPISKARFGMAATVAEPMPITSVEQLKERCESISTDPQKEVAEATVVLKDLILNSKEFVRKLADGANQLASQIHNADKSSIQEYTTVVELIVGLLSHFEDRKISSFRRIESDDKRYECGKALRSFASIVGGVAKTPKEGLGGTLDSSYQPYFYRIAYFCKLLEEVVVTPLRKNVG